MSALTLALAFAFAAPRHAGAAPISVSSATYGAECGAPPGNLTRDAAAHCDHRDTCTYTVNRAASGANATACHSRFAMSWSCGNAETHVAWIAADAGNSTLVISCVIPTGAGH